IFSGVGRELLDSQITAACRCQRAHPDDKRRDKNSARQCPSRYPGFPRSKFRKLLRGFGRHLARYGECKWFCTALLADRIDKAVTPARQGLDVPRVLGGITQCPPEPVHCHVEAVLEVNECPIGPYPLAQLLASNQIARMCQQ